MLEPGNNCFDGLRHNPAFVFLCHGIIVIVIVIGIGIGIDINIDIDRLINCVIYERSQGGENEWSN